MADMKRENQMSDQEYESLKAIKLENNLLKI
jgi:hypothetical protein